MMFKKTSLILKNPISPLVLIAFFIIICILFFTQSKHYKASNESETENHISETIGLTTRFKSESKSSSNLHYYFYYNKKRVLGKIDGRYLNSSVLGNFYLIKFNENNPDKNEMILENEIKLDSTSLINSGFKYIKYYTHNISTNTYEENWKWE